jgi:uncharacterized Zn finger protein (UPF0148 family)
MKSMTLVYIPSKQYRDDPPISLALFSSSPSLTLLDYNFPRVAIQDIKGFEVIILLFASLFRDIIKTGEIDVPSTGVKKETQRLQKMELKAEEKARRARAEEIDRETDRLRKLAHDEYLAKKLQQEEVERETERLRKLEKWPSPPNEKAAKKHWWNTAVEQWGQPDVEEEKYGPRYSMTGKRMMGYSS